MNMTKGSHSFRQVGAIALFVGVVRGEARNGMKVQKLVIEAYEEKADEVLAKISDDLLREPGIVDVQIHHLVGEFGIGEDLVYVLVSGSHRANVWPVLRIAVERYKTETPIFKKEVIAYENGSIKGHWISEKEHQK